MRVADLVLIFGALATGRPAIAQGAADPTARCDGRIVSSIHVTPHAAALIAVPRRLQGLARAIGVIHTTTKAAVVRRFLLLEPGRPCTERLRAESERILRLQPFLADATVRGVDDGAGGVRIEVETVDDVATVLGGSFDGWLPSALTLGDGNVAGQGIYVAVHGERGYAYRNGRSLRLADYQAFGRPYTFAFEAERAPLGSTLTLALGHAFLTDLQRTAWHAGYTDVSEFASYARPQGTSLSAGLDRSFWDVGQVIRIGGRGRTALLGGLLTHERSIPSAQAVVISDSGFVADADTTLEGRFAPYSNIRVNAVAGVRAMTFVTVRGFDALTAAQDVATGVQLGVLLGEASRDSARATTTSSSPATCTPVSARRAHCWRCAWRGKDGKTADHAGGTAWWPVAGSPGIASSPRRTCSLRAPSFQAGGASGSRSSSCSVMGRVVFAATTARA